PRSPDRCRPRWRRAVRRRYPPAAAARPCTAPRWAWTPDRRIRIPLAGILPGVQNTSSNEASMKRLGLLLALCGVVALIERPSAMIPEQVKIDTGLLSGTVGTTQPTVRAFKGIPFAAPPLGENRWKAPQPAAKWDGVRKADAFGAPCAAGAPFGGRGGGRGPGGPGGPGAPGAAAPAQAPAAPAAAPREPARAEDCLYANVWTSATSP